jgi:hypothetical protein
MPLIKESLCIKLNSSIFPKEKSSWKGNVNLLRSAGKRHSKIPAVEKVGTGYLTTIGQEVIEQKFYDRVFKERTLFDYP